ncbi:hypothetical protein KP509_28G068400 [Ceratopteris richardii]|uniref:DNA-directed RNA polymerase III subunit n=1 Tax=Ceratopteris richardii TaxID=49495 RepID=A0A8T2RF46_CERRI|nr:hypothetical protein KP509_28G068400 [Ceratopteris richardii]KAH7294366.1 hypothetical protein KP509_28G068400 [Ceratopteris richardii]KAH7294367.1 hypothetical protein KP509_28G068400 [Ceratopteris richardii]
MAFRGRGRGYGRGPSYIPQARGDDGMPVFARKLDGPPPLFPPVRKLPELPDISKTDEELITRRRRLETFWNASPYYIERPKGNSSDVIADIERYSDKYKPNYRCKRPPLSSVLKLSPAYFPAELLGQQAERKRQYKGTSQWTLDTNAKKNDLHRLDRLETLELKSVKNAEDAEGKEGKKDEGDDEDDEELEEEEEEEIGEDDYAQNFGFDDDDEYLEEDDGGADDEGPIY